VIASCAIGACGLVAAPAYGANAPAVTATTQITPESAVLNGVIDTGNLPTSYTFEYDTVSDWAAGGDNANYAGPFFAPANTGLVTVSAPIGCYPMLSCSPDATPLSPKTKYQFILDAQPGVGGTYTQSQGLSSVQGTFKTTSLGKISLASTKIDVVKGHASLGLACVGAQRCAGDYELTAKHKGKTLTCATGKFSLAGSSVKTVDALLSGKCRSALAKSKSLAIAGKLALTTTTDQPTVKKTVKLIFA
jgi:hypothetical protein